MHAGDFNPSVTTIGVHENVFEILMVLQKVPPTLVPSNFVAPKKGLVHGPPDVFQATSVDVVRDCNLLIFFASRRPWFPILVAVSVLARRISDLVLVTLALPTKHDFGHFCHHTRRLLD
jgi:hypothetical protein